ncbi:hypothetical protein [Streptomyces sp. NPDC058424]|uniref:hypothetical protein n=1 Tax=Streptomyces sp. NPDC058424 TaxID=3346491 RepID=UPI003666ABB2
MFVTDEEWRPDYNQYFVDGTCNGLVVGAPTGRAGMDISFVAGIPGLRNLRLLRGISDISPVASCVGLERLDVSDFSSQELDLSDLVGLREAELPWKVAASCLPRLGALEQLTVTRWRGTALSALGAKPVLRRLYLEAVQSVSTSAEAAELFPELRELRLYDGRLTESGLLAGAQQLRNVALSSAKTDSVTFAAALPHLEYLELENSGDIDTLAPLAEHPTLREVLVTGSTRITDGDLTPLADNPRLTVIAVERGHPHYSHRPAEVRRGT